MLTQDQAEKFSREYQTTTDNILKEHYQMLLLDTLSASPLEKNLAFKGGTALRLAYGSFRFSEDLDFSTLGNIPYQSFDTVIRALPSKIPESKVKEIHEKKHTLFAKIVFDIAFKPIPIGVKVEINKDAPKPDWQVALLKSPFNNLETTARVFTLEAILADKYRLLEERREPRDLFDAWYISQKLNRPFEIDDAAKYTRKELSDRLNPFLPEKQRKVLALFVKTS